MTQYLNILKQADIFDGMNPTQLELIGSYCQEKSFSAGEMIIPEGAGSDELYVIVEGEVEILVNPALVSDQPEEARAGSDCHPGARPVVRRDRPGRSGDALCQRQGKAEYPFTGLAPRGVDPVVRGLSPARISFDV